MDRMKKIPYGKSDFKLIRGEDYYYVDKTSFIPKIEAAADNFFFLRPRRFGKSLLLSMLKTYYDIAERDNFEKWFGGLDIYKDGPTPKMGSYLVLDFDFSSFRGDSSSFEEQFDNEIMGRLDYFMTKYKYLLPDGTYNKIMSISTVNQALSRLCGIVNLAGYGIYLFIDEYDNYTNTLISGDAKSRTAYDTLTHDDGILRSFFAQIKKCTDICIQRMFITGVSPVSMDDITSGYNIGKDHTAVPAFNSMVGFNEEEILSMLDYYGSHLNFNHSTDELLGIMRPWYDNYCFSQDSLTEAPLYNSDMVLSFLYDYTARKCKLPVSMVDRNVKSDISKMLLLVSKDKELGLEDNSVIMEVATKGYTYGNIKDSFRAEELSDKDNLRSLLFYMGYLTFSREQDGDFSLLAIPNLVIREIVYEKLVKMYTAQGVEFDSSQITQCLRTASETGDFTPMSDYISETILHFSSERDKAKGEHFLHGMILSMFTPSGRYFPISEGDAGGGKGYSDIALFPRVRTFPSIKHSFILELKYAKSGASDLTVDNMRKEATEQALRYLSSSRILPDMLQTQIHALVLVFRGVKLEIIEEVGKK